jgi:hypothetical protein
MSADRSLFDHRRIALLLVAVGGEMTEEADRIVPQTVWDDLHEGGFIRTVCPLHGDVYTVLTASGANELENAILDKEAAHVTTPHDERQAVLTRLTAIEKRDVDDRSLTPGEAHTIIAWIGELQLHGLRALAREVASRA